MCLWSVSILSTLPTPTHLELIIVISGTACIEHSLSHVLGSRSLITWGVFTVIVSSLPYSVWLYFACWRPVLGSLWSMFHHCICVLVFSSQQLPLEEVRKKWKTEVGNSLWHPISITVDCSFVFIYLPYYTEETEKPSGKHGRHLKVCVLLSVQPSI